MTTDNRTNEPTEAMILAGLNAYSSKGLELDGYETTEEYPSLEMWGDRFASQMRAALVAAQGAAPQAEGDERIQAWELLVEHPVWRSCFGEERPLIDSMMERIDKLAELEMTVNELAPAPVLPSSGVDEDKLAEVERAAAARAWEEGFLLSTRNSPTQPHPLLARNPYRKENSMAAEIREGN